MIADGERHYLDGQVHEGEGAYQVQEMWKQFLPSEKEAVFQLRLS